jgi:hypothetical protein
LRRLGYFRSSASRSDRGHARKIVVLIARLTWAIENAC